ncbi:DUF441 family protein [Brevibacillus sp. HB1.2]|uniref:DUF441 domain-containing protein n=1 Tax=Brevibacillus sp. HB1.2 TaxID=2738807 RepID=UPI001576D9E2|nr:DUF441 family protein [Brevibacillus sp. HB1.2]NTU22759.1 DUF441 family protein [Brevibacillus sp. HB1.2]
MLHTTIILLVIALLSLVAKDLVLVYASLLLLGLSLLKAVPVMDAIQKPIFHVGLFCLMVFLLIPIAKEKYDFISLGKEMVSWKATIAILAGFIISYVGGKGLSILPDQPVVFIGVTLGTLLAVLLTNGLPAGLIIAAGCIALLSRIFNF